MARDRDPGEDAADDGAPGGPGGPGGAGEPEIHVLPDESAASELAASRIAAALTAAIEARGVAHWVTTGGSTPEPIYRALIREPLRGTVPWDRVHLWWTDDRWAPPDDPLSNALAAWAILLGDVPIPSSRVHVMPIGDALAGGEGPAGAAARYADALHGAEVPVSASGFPIFDVILVGIGSDGHIFSVFPGSATWDSSAWAQAVPAPTHIKPHVERVTLHPGVLDVARLPMAVATGPGKASIVGRIFGPREAERRLPALLTRRPGALWILDEAAAARIPAPVREAAAG